MGSIPQQRGSGDSEQVPNTPQVPAPGERAEIMTGAVHMIQDVVRSVRERGQAAVVAAVQAWQMRNGGAAIIRFPTSGRPRFEVDYCTEGLVPLLFGQLDGPPDGSAK